MSCEASDDLGPLTDYDEAGVDVTLIRWMLSLSPIERLREVQACADFVKRVRELNGIE